ncbi:MAG: transport permease protein [Gaiellaceae bacterium]|nr:MAG: transport permease protein [Gaiellaceae bacterium]
MGNLLFALRPLEFFLVQYRRVWRGTIVTSVANPIFFLLALGVGLGVFVDRSADLAGDVSYLSFVAPGLLAGAAMQIATFESSWPTLAAIKWSRQYHAMLASPLRVGDILLGHQAFIALRLLMTTTIYLLVITVFGAVESPLAVLTVPVGVLVGLAFSAPMAAWAAHTETDASFVTIFRFVILPMFLFSGIFFPVTQLPRVFELVAYATPLWNGVALSRQLSLGEAWHWSAAYHLGFLLVWTAVALVLAYASYRRRLVV